MARKTTAKDILARAKKIKVCAMDVDGVLTAGDIIILNGGEEIKIWSVRDRVGFFLVHRSGDTIPLIWITARASEQVKQRAEDLKITKIFQGAVDKRAVFEQITREFRVKPEEVLFIGDDLIDLPVLSRVGLSVCPQDAPGDVRERVHYVAETPGGKGVFREVIEMVLKAQGLWDKATADYFL